MAITWKNVNAPNFSAGNALLLSGQESMKNAFNSFGDTLTNEGDRRKGINTDKATALMSGISNLDNAAARRAEIMAGLGSNIDRAAVADAGIAQQDFLQKNQLFDQNSAKNQFGLDTQEKVLNSKMLTDRLSQDASRVGTKTDKLKHNILQAANTSEAIAAAAAAEQAIAERDQGYAIDIVKEKNKDPFKPGNQAVETDFPTLMVSNWYNPGTWRGSNAQEAANLENTYLNSLTKTERTQAMSAGYADGNTFILEDAKAALDDAVRIKTLKKLEGTKEEKRKNNIKGINIKLEALEKRRNNGLGDATKLTDAIRALKQQLKDLG